mmetsp:Transcript_17350/g.40451  ORF Transcript_17350/g.40451 Transcript_17350/m.40451 type:complete len:148 (+) Transcript_17350:4668-5111(+)
MAAGSVGKVKSLRLPGRTEVGSGFGSVGFLGVLGEREAELPPLHLDHREAAVTSQDSCPGVSSAGAAVGRVWRAIGIEVIPEARPDVAALHALVTDCMDLWRRSGRPTRSESSMSSTSQFALASLATLKCELFFWPIGKTGRNVAML